MKIVDWTVAAKDANNDPVLYWDGEYWVRDPGLAKPYYQEMEARVVMSRLRVPVGTVKVGLIKYESSVKE